MCDMCSFVGMQEVELRNHVARSHGQQSTFMCDYCGFSSPRKYDLKRHIASRHADGAEGEESVFICALCNRPYSKKSTLRKHIFKLHFTKRGEQCSIKWRRGFCCDLCGLGFDTQNEMLAHRKVVHADAAPLRWYSFRSSLGKLKLCEHCKRYYRDGRFWNEHSCDGEEDPEAVEKIKSVLGARPGFKCELCSVCFLWKWLYREHRETMHRDSAAVNWDALSAVEVPFYCMSCYLAFDDESMVENHECVKLDSLRLRLHACDLCGTNYQRRSDYMKHLRSKHSGSAVTLDESRKKALIQCPYCEETAPTRTGILEHVKDVHKVDIDTPYVCVPCNKVFKRKVTLDTHNEVYHPKVENAEEKDRILKEAEILLNGEPAFHCNVCNRNMYDETKFLAHHRLHFVERKYTCDLCGKQTRTQHQLNSHIRIIHLNIRNFECDICGKSFHARQSCEEHRRIHTGERPFSCEKCGKTFVAMNALLTHQKFHNDFYAHACHMCPKKFKIRRSLTNHIRTHTGERPYKCELCSKTFNNSSRFSYHQKVTHSEARPFTCATCGSCFKANKFLLRHMKLHSIRKHIQLRRKNNPAYFASQRGASKTIPKKELDIEKVDFVSAGKTEGTVITTAIYNLEGVEMQLDQISEENDGHHFICDDLSPGGNEDSFGSLSGT